MIEFKLYHDPNAHNPREDDNVSIMLCSHRGYSLGDENAVDSLLEEIRESKYYKESWENDINLQNPNDMLELANKARIVAYSTPLYLYDHSGLTVSSTHFGCQWDTSLLGHVIVTKKTALYEYGFKRISKKSTEKLERIVQSEIKEYDFHLRGEAYSYVIEEDGEVIDSSESFLGSNIKESGMLDNLDKKYHNLALAAEPIYA